MDVYDTNAAHSVSDDGISNCEEVITRIVTDLFSYDDIKRRRIFDHYYFPNATFTSPILRTEGVHNIKHVLLVWKTLNREQPQINNICFNGKTCVVFLTQTLCPRMFPWIKIALPVTVVLEFKETDKDSGLLKIETHQEQWTIEGILKAIPFVSFWYDHVVRTMIGKLLSATGEAVYTATETASLLVLRSKEIEEAKRRLESGAYVVIDDNDAGIDQAKKQEQVMMLRIKNSSFSSTAS
ncbi:hypothetical protein V8B55DRAFT_1504105 [Mucor lusitanicus]|uniref:SigF-like NTF2-like domain-containing protein n=2 Tax=Mucor circinelloides f. lusitanicus TaxID=29924 RepID=A0A162R6U6_MUCCL|nr:hypothetical protein FB192DRAFT_1367337 [Mucor lusitanicus]OAD08870.1 hypothetical protein MUCCIDRAFT_155042 [Mucor lusitanicus CBS 277.49]